MERSESPLVSLDRVGVAIIAGLGFVFTPGLMLTSIWVLSHELAPAESTPVELAFMLLSVLLGVYVARITARELRWGVGVRFDDQGIQVGSIRLRWDEVESLRAPGFGVLELGGGGKLLPLRTYLYEDRKGLLEYISRHTGKPVPELSMGR